MHKNYFELYNIPMNFRPDLAIVKKQFYSLSKQYHPDFFGSADKEKQQEAIELTAEINEAYQLFQSQEEVIKYILQLHLLVEVEEKYVLSPDFLMEVMELNERIMELDATDVNEKKLIQEALEELEHSIYEMVNPIITSFKEGVSTEKELLQVKDYYYKKKYLDRIGAALK